MLEGIEELSAYMSFQELEYMENINSYFVKSQSVVSLYRFFVVRWSNVSLWSVKMNRFFFFFYRDRSSLQIQEAFWLVQIIFTKNKSTNSSLQWFNSNNKRWKFSLLKISVSQSCPEWTLLRNKSIKDLWNMSDRASSGTSQLTVFITQEKGLKVMLQANAKLAAG